MTSLRKARRCSRAPQSVTGRFHAFQAFFLESIKVCIDGLYTAYMDSRAKGKRGELEACGALARIGLDCRRTVQYSGRAGTSDVICEDAPNLHIEVKLTERLNPYGFMDQAIRDMHKLPHVPTIVCRSSYKPWLVILQLEDIPRFVEAYTNARRVPTPSTGQGV